MTTGAEIPLEVIREAARHEGVCLFPIITRLHDTVEGTSRLVPIPCGSTRESQCAPCAEKARKLRMQQCREGWHLDHEPVTDDDQDDDSDQDNAAEGEGEEEDGPGSRRVRSTRRRQDAPDLPRQEVQPHTIGPVFGTEEKTYRPSMFATLTLGSYGRVRSDGTPVDPETYDYRRAALDAMHFPKLVDRFWQNLRRAVGWKVQYFAALEPQRRLAPHLHAAIRGAIPRAVLKQVIAGTYHQVWWPAFDQPVYVDELPVWDATVVVGTDEFGEPVYGGYLDPESGELLPTWQQALDALDDDPTGRPAHVVRFGEQTDLQGIDVGSMDADRRIGYLCKYLTKSITDTYDPHQTTARRNAHIDRLWEETRWLPCAPTCANWLRYGIQPKGARPQMQPGLCRGKAHRRDTVGCGGRRVLVSRQWTGKTLTEHRADRAAVVRAVLEEAGIDAPDVDRYSTKVTTADGKPRFVWSAVRSEDELPSYRAVLIRALRERQRWRVQYERAKERAGSTRELSATKQPAAAAA